MFSRHPRKQVLQEWLEGTDHPEIDSHLASCRRCASIIDELAGSEDQAIGDALAAVYLAPEDLSDRLERRVVARLDSRVVLEVVADLFGAGVETSKLLLTEAEPNE